MIMTDKGLDLNFEETKKSLNIPTKSGRRIRSYKDPMFGHIADDLRQQDYKQYLTRFKWNNLPDGMDSELFERVMYFHGSGMFFYIKELEKFFFLPYGMSGEGVELGIDFYGRFNKIKPYSFNGSTKVEAGGDKKPTTADLYLSTQIRENIIDVPFVKDEKRAKDIYENGAVICFDSSPGLNYYVNARNRVSKSYIDYMIKVLIQTKSALINASGYNLFSSDSEVDSELMQAQLDMMNEDREHGALSGIISSLLGEIQNLQSNAPNAMTDFWATYESTNNLRLRSMGIQNDGTIQKSQYQNIQEQAMDINDSMQVYWNAFMERVKFSAIVNSIWGLDIYPEPLHISLLNMGGMGLENPEEGDSTQAQGGTEDEN